VCRNSRPLPVRPVVKIKPVRRESSTVIALVGEISGQLLDSLARTPNISVVRAASVTDPALTAAAGHTAAQPGWEPAAQAMREAARRRSTYVIVAADPLADVAAGWRSMWDVRGGSGGTADFEVPAADALAAWRDKRFELPDYYLVVSPARPEGTGPDLYLGPLRSVRPRRVAVAVAGTPDGPAAQTMLLDSLRSLEHGPWWPPLDELLEAARHFYAGGLAETHSGRRDRWRVP
jgi:hypothetical protein